MPFQLDGRLADLLSAKSANAQQQTSVPYGQESMNRFNNQQRNAYLNDQQRNAYMANQNQFASEGMNQLNDQQRNAYLSDQQRNAYMDSQNQMSGKAMPNLLESYNQFNNQQNDQFDASYLAGKSMPNLPESNNQFNDQQLVPSDQERSQSIPYGKEWGASIPYGKEWGASIPYGRSTPNLPGSYNQFNNQMLERNRMNALRSRQAEAYLRAMEQYKADLLARSGSY